MTAFALVDSRRREMKAMTIDDEQRELTELRDWMVGYAQGRDAALRQVNGDDLTEGPPADTDAVIWGHGFKAGYTEGSATRDITEMVAAVGAACDLGFISGMPRSRQSGESLIYNRLKSHVSAREALGERKEEQARERARENSRCGRDENCARDRGHRGKCRP